MKKIFVLTVIFTIALILPACSVFGLGVGKADPVQPSSTDAGTIHTQVAETVQAWMVETTVAQIQMEMAITSTSTPTLEPTSTQQPVDTLTPTLNPTASNTAVILPGDWIGFVDDVTVDDNSVFTPGAQFTKVWRLKNIGTRTWTTDYDLGFVGGEPLGAKTTIPLSFSLAPGQTADFSISMVAPKTAGTYTSQWMLRNANGILFGAGEDADSPIWVKIKVAEAAQLFKNDFASAYCTASWSSQVGNLPCPGDSSSTSGFVLRLSDPDLENRQENEPALWMRPNKGGSGWISGIYPPVVVKRNDHFLTWVGCLDDSEGCDLTFQFGYLLGNGSVKKLGEWREVYDGKVTTIDLDLSVLADKEVRFVLSVINHGAFADADGFWFVPRLENILPTQTPKPSATPTSTPTPTATLLPSLTPTPSPTATELPLPPYHDHPAVIKAIDTFALEQGTSPAQVRLVFARLMEWADTCLELPAEGEVCAPQITPGFFVLVEYERMFFEIHTNEDGSNVRWTVFEPMFN